MKSHFRRSQLSLAIEPAADPPKRATLRDDLPQQLARLTPTEQRILRLKALVGEATNKTDFQTLLNGSGVTAPVGGSWSYNLVNQILNRLLTLGLLKPDFFLSRTAATPPRGRNDRGARGARSRRGGAPDVSGRRESPLLLFVFPPNRTSAPASDCDCRSTKNDGDAFRAHRTLSFPDPARPWSFCCNCSSVSVSQQSRWNGRKANA